MAQRPDDLPEWAPPANYSDPGTDWDGQPNLNETDLVAFAAAGYTPDQPTDAPSQNAWNRRIWQWQQFLHEAVVALHAGDGSDGDHTVAGTETLTRDMYYDTLTVPAGTVLNTANYAVFAKSAIINEGSIRNNGGAGGDGAVSSGGTAGAAVASGTLGGGSAGGAGGNGANGTAGTAIGTSAIGGQGGNGGAGDTSSDSFTGGLAGALTSPTTAAGGTRIGARLGSLITGRDLLGNILRGGTGGGGGGSGEDTGGLNRSGGGGGAGAGVMLLVTPRLANNGVISANGGDGGDGSNAIASSGGGGGGGGGGAIGLVCADETGSGSVTVSGGAGGLPGVSVPGATAGNDGNDGRIYRITGASP